MYEQLSKRAKEIIEKILYITIATASKDGTPWNSPAYSAFDQDYNFYWASDQNGQHSKNIAENDNVFIVIYDSTVPEGTGKGVYIQAKAYKLEDPKDIEYGLKYLEGRVNRKKDPKTRIAEFQGENPRRVYKAIPEKVWMNGDGDINGKYIDIRMEVELLNK
ncbi:MAG TPA: pyridoxamine 5'-phosphate oxidase family protein [Bacillus sp. (in: firmicutes)]|nr:pyridoxamine 5'-phosphate oxidase family protein [Bacillus sp. (in: firmicutes)]